MLGIDELMAEIILALGAALAGGMGLALFGPALRDRYGISSQGSRDGSTTVGRRLEGTARLRAAFLFAVGLLMAIWGLATMVAK